MYFLIQVLTICIELFIVATITVWHNFHFEVNTLYKFIRIDTFKWNYDSNSPDISDFPFQFSCAVIVLLFFQIFNKLKKYLRSVYLFKSNFIAVNCTILSCMLEKTSL